MFNFFNHNTKQECEIELMEGYEDISTTKNIIHEIQGGMKMQKEQKRQQALWNFSNNYCTTKNCVNYTLHFFIDSKYTCSNCNHIDHNLIYDYGNCKKYLGLKPLEKNSNCLKCNNKVIIETKVKGTCNLCYNVIDIQKIIYNNYIERKKDKNSFLWYDINEIII